MAVKYWQGGWLEQAVVGSDDEKAGQTARYTDFGRTWRQFLARPVKSPWICRILDALMQI